MATNLFAINVYKYNGNTNGLPAGYSLPAQGVIASPVFQTTVIGGVTMNSVIKLPNGDQVFVAQTPAQVLTLTNA